MKKEINGIEYTMAKLDDERLSVIVADAGSIEALDAGALSEASEEEIGEELGVRLEFFARGEGPYESVYTVLGPRYAYRVYDSDPTVGSSNQLDTSWSHWPDADYYDDPEALLDAVLDVAADVLEPVDGYEYGDYVYAIVDNLETETIAASGERVCNISPSNEAPATGSPEWEHVADYVWLDGDRPLDCYTSIAQSQDGRWHISDGDDNDREVGDVDFDTEAEAREAAEELAETQHEGEPGEDAEAYTLRTLRETAGEPDPAGEWCVYWETVGDDQHVVDRYSTSSAASAAAELAELGLRKNHPGDLLCGYSVRMLVGGRWIDPEVES